MRLTRILVPTGLLVFAFWLLQSGVAHAQEPDFTNQPDILNGQNQLLRTDDIVEVDRDDDVRLRYLLTANGAVASVQENDTPVPPGANPDTQCCAGDSKAAVGRMFDLPNDVVAVLSAEPIGVPNPVTITLTILDPKTNTSFSLPVASLATQTFPVNHVSLVMADFTGDGYDDLALNYDTNYTATDNPSGNVRVLKAADPLSFSAGLTMGSLYTTTLEVYAFAAARIGGQQLPHLLIATSDGLTGRGGLDVLSVDPKSLAITRQSGVGWPPGSIADHVAIVSGNFDNDPTNQEAVVFVDNEPNDAVALLYSFPTPQLTPVLLDTNDLGPNITPGPAAGGRVHPFGSDSDAVAVGLTTYIPPSTLTYSLVIYTVENNQLVQQTSLPQNDFVGDVAFGRFDNRSPGGDIVPDLQLAVLSLTNPQNQTPPLSYVNTYNVGSGGVGYTLIVSSPQPTGFDNVYYGPALAVGDLQGRSLRLGAPTKLTIEGHNSPRTILGMPPMHLDWVKPSCTDPNFPDCISPQVVGIQAKPSLNWAQFNTSLKQTDQSSTKNSMSYALALRANAEFSASYGIPDLASISTSTKVSADSTFKTSVDTEKNAFATFTFDTSTKTGFGDHLWYDAYRMNIWTYPVIGQSACPAGIPNCSDNQKQPLLVRFSGPDSAHHFEGDGNLLPWYQPVWEPGNLLSYPWTQDQLLKSLARPVVNNQSDIWFADTSTSSASVAWSQGSGQNVTSGYSNQVNEDSSWSVSGKISLEGFGASASVGLGTSTNQTNAALQTNSTQTGSSTGFTVNKAPQGVADYAFAAQTYIVGQAPITGTIHTLPLTTTVQANGPLRLAYWVDPLEPPLPAIWWTSTYSLPDVALNHPQRWTWKPPSGVNPDSFTFNHIVSGQSPYEQWFYFMRGLFVTDATSPGGPQLTQGTITQTLLLQARVYNYSMVAMPQTTKVKVRFYGQTYVSTPPGSFPASGNFLITETVLSPILGFGTSDQPNWRMATATFNPADFAQTRDGNVDLRFWVVTWMEDANGNKIAEPTGHGLLKNPATLTINGMGDVPVDDYSNNVGTLDQVYHVLGPTGALTGIPSAAADGAPAGSLGAAQPPTVTVQAEVTVPAPQPPTAGGPFGRHTLTAVFHSGSAPLGSVQLLFFDGDPAKSGRMVGWKLIPYVGANTPFVNRVNYAPQQCGMRTIYVQAIAGTQVIATTTEVDNVPCIQILPFVSKQ